jgi:hypothetical protein
MVLLAQCSHQGYGYITTMQPLLDSDSKVAGIPATEFFTAQREKNAQRNALGACLEKLGISPHCEASDLLMRFGFTSMDILKGLDDNEISNIFGGVLKVAGGWRCFQRNSRSLRQTLGILLASLGSRATNF